MRGLLVQPRATVQVDRWNGRETEPAHGVKRQGPNGFPPTLILTHFQDTGTHNHRSKLLSAVAMTSPAYDVRRGVWVRPSPGRRMQRAATHNANTVMPAQGLRLCRWRCERSEPRRMASILQVARSLSSGRASRGNVGAPQDDGSAGFAETTANLMAPSARNHIVAVAQRMIYNLCTDAIAIPG
jgi:hypothetical protein